MPAYTYECEKCGDLFDIRRRMTDEGPVVCTACGSKRVRRVYHAVAVVGRPASSSSGAYGGSACSACSSTNCGTCSYR